MCQNCDDERVEDVVTRIAKFLTDGGYGRVGALILNEFSPLDANGDT